MTHNHHDHTEAVGHLRSVRWAPLAAVRASVHYNLDVCLKDGDTFGPLEAIATPGHASDHIAIAFGKVCFTGDAVLGEGSVFISPESGALVGYLAGLERLRMRKFVVLCPGHGAPIWDTHKKLAEYIDHRLSRERKLIEALAEGRRSVDDLLDFAWSDIPNEMRGVAELVLATHLDKLANEKRLPDGVERPQINLAAQIH